MVTPHRASGRPVIFWVSIGLALTLLLAAGWVLVRALIARDQLIGALPIAEEIQMAVVEGDASSIESSITELRDRAELAASLTSDPIWRAGEVVPVIGANLTAFRQSAALIHDIAEGALPSLENLASVFTVANLVPQGSRIDLAAYREAAPLLASANAALSVAALDAQSIDTSATVPQVGEAVDQVITLVDETQVLVGSLDQLVRLIPPMVGSTEPRHYLLLSVNNAELRSTGGVTGTVALLSADDGHLTLERTTSSGVIGEFDAPVVPLTASEDQLFSELLATYVQDVNFTPDFARSGEIAAAMWNEYSGEDVDGVIAIDHVALGYVLEALGPIEVSGGWTLTPETAATTLMSDVFGELAREDLDGFFAEVIENSFAALIEGQGDAQTLVDALRRASNERRVHVWSAHPDEQSLLAGSSLSGPLPQSTDSTSAFGVYLNDATGGRMGYYLNSSIAIASGLCGAQARPNFGVQIRLQSTAPLDAATGLAPVVTGAGEFGVTPGDTLTNVYLYAPEGTEAYAVTIDGVKAGFATVEHDGLTVIAMRVNLAPGQAILLDLRLLGRPGSSIATTVEHTPMANSVPVSLDNFLDCPVPPTGTDTQS